VGNEHDDDLGSTVDTRDDVETDDFPATSDDFDAQEQEQGEPTETKLPTKALSVNEVTSQLIDAV
jgi:hypothetical protein